MNLPVILAIAGCAALLAGLFGGGVKAKEIVVPKLSTMPRILSSLTGLVLIGVAIWTSQNPSAEVPATQVPPTEAPPSQVSPTEVSPTQLPPTEVPQPTATNTEQPTASSSMVTSAPASDDPNSRAVFVHFGSSENMSGSSTAIEHALSSDPNALLFVTLNWGPKEIYYYHFIAVWYDKSQWAIINQDGHSMIHDSAFNVRILNQSENAFIHTATTANISESWTVIDRPLASDPNALVFATPNWSPPAGGAANDANHPIGVWYTGSKWAIFNMDGAPMRAGSAFNVEIRSPADNAFFHTSPPSNTPETKNYTVIDNQNASVGSKLVFVMPRGSPDGTQTNNREPIGVYYEGRHWAIFNQWDKIQQSEPEPMPDGAAFNVLIVDAK